MSKLQTKFSHATKFWEITLTVKKELLYNMQLPYVYGDCKHIMVPLSLYAVE